MPVGEYGGAGGTGSAVGVPIATFGGGGDEPSAEWYDSIDRARSRLAGGQFAGSTFGSTLQNRYLNPYGFSPETRRGLEVQAEERLAGRMANTKDNARLYANATGGLDSAGLAHLNSQIEAGTARDLNSEMTNIAAQDEAMGMQRELGSAGYLASLMGLEESTNRAAANFEGNIQWPMDGGSEQPWVGEGEPNLLNERGEITLPPSAPDWMKNLAIQQRQRYMNDYANA
jgi:hypothetical protein